MDTGETIYDNEDEPFLSDGPMFFTDAYDWAYNNYKANYPLVSVDNLLESEGYDPSDYTITPFLSHA